MKPSDELAAALEKAGSAQERFEIMYGTLRDRISMSDYPPGTRLSEEALAASQAKVLAAYEIGAAPEVPDPVIKVFD